MPGETILLDPADEGTGAELDVTDGALGYFLLAHDYPPAEDEGQWASSSDTEGEQRSNTRPRNRVITLTVRCIEPPGGTPEIGEIVSALTSTIAKLHRDGGTYRRVFPSGDQLTFDVRAARVVKIPADKAWITNRRADVELELTCAPYGREPEVSLQAHIATCAGIVIITEPEIRGDVDALARIIINAGEVSPTDRRWLAWGLRSRHHSPDLLARLLFDAADADVTVPGGAALVSDTAVDAVDAVGGLVAHVATLSTAVATPSKLLTVNGLKHTGAYRVLARVHTHTDNTGTVSFQARYNTPSRIEQAAGPWQPFDPAWEGNWRLFDLGQLALPALPGETPAATLEIVAASTAAGDEANLDFVLLLPFLEGSGRAVGIVAATSINVLEQTAQIDDAGALNVTGSHRAPIYLGDHLRIPPSGPEGRTLEIVVKAARNNVHTDAHPRDDILHGAGGLENMTATLHYTPRWLAVPKPSP